MIMFSGERSIFISGCDGVSVGGYAEHTKLSVSVCVRVRASGAATRQILTIRENIFTQNITQHMFEHSQLTQCQQC